MAKKKVEEKINLDAILFKCRDILRKARNSGSFFEKRDMMLTLVFLRFIGEKFEDGVENLRQNLIKEGLDPDDEAIKAAFLDDPTFTDGTFFQYIGPTLMFLLAVTFYGEKPGADKMVTFAFIWVALAIFVMDAIYTQRRTSK